MKNKLSYTLLSAMTIIGILSTGYSLGGVNSGCVKTDDCIKGLICVEQKCIAPNPFCVFKDTVLAFAIIFLILSIIGFASETIHVGAVELPLIVATFVLFAVYLWIGPC